MCNKINSPFLRTNFSGQKLCGSNFFSYINASTLLQYSCPIPFLGPHPNEDSPLDPWAVGSALQSNKLSNRERKGFAEDLSDGSRAVLDFKLLFPPSQILPSLCTWLISCRHAIMKWILQSLLNPTQYSNFWCSFFFLNNKQHFDEFPPCSINLVQNALMQYLSAGLSPRRGLYSPGLISSSPPSFDRLASPF